MILFAFRKNDGTDDGGDYFHFKIDGRTEDEVVNDSEFIEFYEEENEPVVEVIEGNNEMEILNEIKTRFPGMYDPGLERFLMKGYNSHGSSPSDYKVQSGHRPLHISNRAPEFSSASTASASSSVVRPIPRSRPVSPSRASLSKGKKRGRPTKEEEEDEETPEEHEVQRKPSFSKNAISKNSGFELPSFNFHSLRSSISHLPESPQLSRDDLRINNEMYLPSNPLRNDDNDDDMDDDMDDENNMDRERSRNISDRNTRMRRSSIDDYEGLVLSALLENHGADNMEESAWKTLNKTLGRDVRNDPYLIMAMNKALTRN